MLAAVLSQPTGEALSSCIPKRNSNSWKGRCFLGYGVKLSPKFHKDTVKLGTFSEIRHTELFRTLLESLRPLRWKLKWGYKKPIICHRERGVLTSKQDSWWLRSWVVLTLTWEEGRALSNLKYTSSVIPKNKPLFKQEFLWFFAGSNKAPLKSPGQLK